MAALEGMVRLALVQSDLGAAAHVGVRGPVEHEQRAFDAVDSPAGRPPVRSDGDTRRACAGSGSAAWSGRPWWDATRRRSPCRRPVAGAASGHRRVRRCVKASVNLVASSTSSRGRRRGRRSRPARRLRSFRCGACPRRCLASAVALAHPAASSLRRPSSSAPLRSASQSCGLAGTGRLRSASTTAGADSSVFLMSA